MTDQLQEQARELAEQLVSWLVTDPKGTAFYEWAVPKAQKTLARALAVCANEARL